MADFKKSFGGHRHGGGDTFNRGSSGRPDFKHSGGRNGEREMFKATCAECGKPCEVPFRPSGDRPVYCRDCFQKMGGPQTNDRGNQSVRGPAHSFPKRDFPPRPYTPPAQGAGEDKRLDDLKIQLATAISKLDKLINIMMNNPSFSHGQKHPEKTEKKAESLQQTIASVVPTGSTKKGNKKARISSKKKPASKNK